MVVINNNTDEQNNLLKEGYSARPGMPANFAGIDPILLQFITNVPANYRILAVALLQKHTFEFEDRQKTKNRESHDLQLAFEMATAAQREIDQNRLKFMVNGKNIDISQGDLRKIMEERVTELKDRKKVLLRSGQNPEELHRIEGLIERYEPVIEKTKRGKANEETKADIRDLMKDDSNLTKRFESYNNKHSSVAVNDIYNRRTSFSAEHFDTNAPTASKLRETFAKGASPELQPPPAIKPPEPTKPNPFLNNTFESAGI